MIAQTVALSAGSVAAVIALIAGATMAAARNETLQPASEFVVRYASNPLTWIAILGSLFLVGTLRNRRSGQEHLGQETTDHGHNEHVGEEDGDEASFGQLG